ncbi:ATP-binding protein [Vogesella sp. LIG4]|uniref:ATP-binding protein n=1 Tax=Vogesella sp. LIG4 TaxID=1192162 RepID=UPI00081F8584|nr:ATP-binding protein [Vogesella sp. LIG4]SCK19029.1 protein-histidine pros-kinase [Vogesella sp. LIG4]
MLRAMQGLLRRVPDTMFTRLFGLAAAGLLITHLVMTSLFLVFAPHHEPPPPPAMSAAGQHAGPPPPPPRHQHFPPEFWLGQVLTLAIISLLAWYGARRLARPIQQLTHAAARLGDNLQAPPVEEAGPAETRQAARLFNHMQDRLRQQMAERSRFLAAVSHDLRTPLTRIRLRCAQLDDPALQGKLAKDIDDMAAMLDATLAYLRDDARTEQWQWLDVGALLQALVEDAQELGQQLQLNGRAGRLYTLPDSLRRCLGNLLENAMRYGGGQVEITLRQQAGELCIDIRDYGPGIPEDQLESVFEPFVRLEESRNRHSGGTGLGLSIARDAARRLGGSLSLSNAPGGGLNARLLLPQDKSNPLGS